MTIVYSCSTEQTKLLHLKSHKPKNARNLKAQNKIFIIVLFYAIIYSNYEIKKQPTGRPYGLIKNLYRLKFFLTFECACFSCR